MAMMPPMTVVETEEFVDHSKAILTETERDALVAHLGANPEAGQLVPGTGGVRKIRWASRGHGKRAISFRSASVKIIAVVSNKKAVANATAFFVSSPSSRERGTTTTSSRS